MEFREILRKRLLFISATGILMLVLSGVLLSFTYTEARSSGHLPKNTSPFFSQPATWLFLPPTFAGKIAHFSLVESVYLQGDPGSDYHSTLLGDVWEKIDARGQLQIYHATWTSMDKKTFYQEIYEDSSANIVVFGKSNPNSPHILYQSPATSCLEHLPTQSSAARDAELVPFANVVEMLHQGFSVSQSTSKVSQVAPNLVAPTSIRPVKQYSANNFVHVWTKTEIFESAGAKRFSHLEVDQQYRVLIDSSTVTDMKGKVISSNTFAYGPIALYNTQDVFVSALSNSQQILAKGCSR